MSKVSPNKVWLQYRDGVSPDNPIVGRIYTMTHSDETADLFVVVGKQIAADQINETRDEVCLRWMKRGQYLCLYGEALVDIDRNRQSAEFRNQIFMKEMPTALTAIRTADACLFEACPQLDNTPVYIQYRSSFSQYHRMIEYGVIGDYKVGCNN